MVERTRRRRRMDQFSTREMYVRRRETSRRVVRRAKSEDIMMVRTTLKDMRALNVTMG